MIRIIIILLLSAGMTIRAATITATSPSSTDVQFAINQAANGDTVIVPSGSATWSVEVGFSGKSLVIIGGGGTNGTTTITDAITDDTTSCIHFSADPPNFVRVSHFAFLCNTGIHNGNNGIIHVDGTIRYFGFRIDNCSFTLNHQIGGMMIIPYQDYGLIDHNQFIANINTYSSQKCMYILGTAANEDAGYPPWMYYGTNGFSLGDSNAVFIEDNSFYYNPIDAGAEDAIDAANGARTVIRHNTFTNQSVGFHGLDSGNARSPISFEIYSNSFINNSANTYHSGNSRGGTGVLFGNTYGGTHNVWNAFSLLCYRATQSYAWGHLDGTQWLLESSSFSSSGIFTAAQYPTGTIGFDTNNNELLGTYTANGRYSRFLDGNGPGGYPGRDQCGIAPGQISYPVWCWDNGGVTLSDWNNFYPPTLTFYGNNQYITNWILAGRDYTNSVIAKPGYVAYTYPYPLISQTNPPPSIPTGFHILTPL